MILQEFSKILNKYIDYMPSTIILMAWLKNILEREPREDVEKIIHAELTLIKDKKGNYTITGKKKSGQKLIKNLYNYIESYETQTFCRWLHEIKANDFPKQTEY